MSPLLADMSRYIVDVSMETSRKQGDQHGWRVRNGGAVDALHRPLQSRMGQGSGRLARQDDRSPRPPQSAGLGHWEMFGGSPFGPWWGGPRAWRGPKARRGDVRAAILAVLAEQPMNGYQIIQEIADP